MLSRHAVDGSLAAPVNYVVADLLDLPRELAEQRFDLVVEAYTVQVLPPESPERAASFGALTSVTGDTLFVIARGREPTDDPGFNAVAADLRRR